MKVTNGKDAMNQKAGTRIGKDSQRLGIKEKRFDNPTQVFPKPDKEQFGLPRDLALTGKETFRVMEEIQLKMKSYGISNAEKPISTGREENEQQELQATQKTMNRRDKRNDDKTFRSGREDKANSFKHSPAHKKSLPSANVDALRGDIKKNLKTKGGRPTNEQAARMSECVYILLMNLYDGELPGIDQYIKDLILLKDVLNSYSRNARIVWFTFCVLVEMFSDDAARHQMIRRVGSVNPLAETVIYSIRMQRDVASIQSTGFRILCLLMEEKVAREYIVDHEVIDDICNAMRTFTNDDMVQCASCDLLGRLALEVPAENKIREKGGLIYVLNIIVNENSLPACIISALIAMWNCTFSDNNRAYYIKKGAHIAILNALNSELDCTREQKQKIVANALGVIWNLADYVDGKPQMIKEEIPQAVVKAMSMFRHHEQTQEKGCGCLRSLAYTDTARVTLMDIGAAEKILQSMEDHVTSQTIQYQAFAVLKKLSCNDVNEGRLISMGAGQRILAAMQAHPKVASIQERACGVLWNLAVKDDHKLLLVTIGCGQRILEAMETHPDNGGVQYQTCRTLKRLARDAQNENRLMELGAAKFVLKAMKNHIKNHDIQEKGCGVLWNLSDQEEHKTMLMAEGAAKQILESMKEHLNNENVQYEACGALKRLAVDDEIEVQLMEMNAAEHVLKAMQTHQTNHDVQSQACGVLWNLAFNGQVQLMGLNAYEQIFAAMKAHPRNFSVQEKACGTLWKLVEIPENNEKLIRLGVVPVVLEAMEKNLDSPGVQYQACGTLWNLSVRDANRAILMSLRSEDRILAAMEKHFVRADIIQAACGALSHLSQGSFNVPAFCYISPNDKKNVGSALSMKQIGEMTGKNPGLSIIDKDTTVSVRLLLVNKGALHLIIKSIDNHGDQVDVIIQAMTALDYLSMDAKNLLRFIEPRIISSITRAIHIHSQEESVQEHGIGLLCRVMKRIAAANRKPSAHFQVNGVISQFVDSKKISLPIDIIKNCLETVLNILRNHQLIKKVQDPGLEFLLQMFLYSADVEIKAITNEFDRRKNLGQSRAALLRQESEDSISEYGSIYGVSRLSLVDNDASTAAEQIFTVASMEGTMQCIDRILDEKRRESVAAGAAIMLMKKVFHFSADWRQSGLFEKFKTVILRNRTVLLSQLAYHFSISMRHNQMRRTACWVIRFILNSCPGIDVRPLMYPKAEFPDALIDDIQHYKKNCILNLLTLQEFLRNINYDKFEDFNISDEMIGAGIKEVLTDKLPSFRSGSQDGMNIVLCVSHFLQEYVDKRPVILEHIPGELFCEVFMAYMKMQKEENNKKTLTLGMLSLMEAVCVNSNIRRQLLKKPVSLLAVLRDRMKLELQQSMGYTHTKINGFLTRKKSNKKHLYVNRSFSRFQQTFKRRGKRNSEMMLSEVETDLAQNSSGRLLVPRGENRASYSVMKKVMDVLVALGVNDGDIAHKICAHDEIMSAIRFLWNLEHKKRATKEERSLASHARVTLKTIEGRDPGHVSDSTDRAVSPSI